MSEEKPDQGELKDGLMKRIDDLEDEIDENVDKGKESFESLTSGIREKIDGIGDSDNDGER